MFQIMTSTISVGGGKIFISSDEKVSCVQDLNFNSVTFFKPSERTDNEQNGTASPKKSGKALNVKNGSAGIGVVCMGVSSCGNYLGVCGENKMLTVFHNNEIGDKIKKIFLLLINTEIYTYCGSQSH